ncbi:MAG: flavin reductase family protein, partial [Betaproteobacteria bacterium]|nr:flavin reductase family protein [Betaproteobacteria bacterium]NCP81592.1 flavin reductase family protein [Rhodoferax sp.]
KDSVRNIEQTGEFVWNLVTRPLAEVMNQTCAAVAPEISEFDLAGLTPVASRLVAAPRVAQSPVAFECRLTQLVQLQAGSGEKLDSWLVLGEVVAVHIAQRLLKQGVYDTASAEHVLRGGGAADYFLITPAQLFKLHRPK